MKAIKQYFSIVPFVHTLYTVGLKFESVDEFLECDVFKCNKLLSSAFLWYWLCNISFGTVDKIFQSNLSK